MIVETIFSTIDKSGRPNFAPMGIIWGEERVTVRPYRQTQTYHNLASTRHGVANVSDDILAYVRCALYDEILSHFPARACPGVVFSNTCYWRELEVVSQGGTAERAEFDCRIVHEDRQKIFLGFRRASNAVIEATILATRMRFHDPKIVSEKMVQYQEIVQRTGDATELQAFHMVQAYVRGERG